MHEIRNPVQYEFGGKGGVSLESVGAGPLRTAYIATGTPQHDEQGRISSAVIVNAYYLGDSTWCYSYWYDGLAGNDFSLGPAVVGPGKLIDTNRYYVVFLDALGLWGASKPSDGLGLNFPQYTMFDMVQANYRLLKDELNISRVRLAEESARGIPGAAFASFESPLGHSRCSGLQTFSWAKWWPSSRKSDSWATDTNPCSRR
jgi:hypothetical protein